MEGRLTDNMRTELSAATVRCFVGDTVFVKGTTTNGKGEFKIDVKQNVVGQCLKFNYLGYKELTVNLPSTSESTIRLGDIVMNSEFVQVQEVTVLGSNRVRTEEKTTIYPTREELRYAYDGYSAIESLMIPGLMVNTISSGMSYLNQAVTLLINGREATQEEVQNLNSKDIKRVDFYSNGRPDYPDASSIIDFVMKERNYAGTVALSGMHYMNVARGNARATAQYFRDKSEIAVSVSDNYRHFREHDDGETATNYMFPAGAITRTEQKLPSLGEHNTLKTYANYIYREKQQDFYASLRFNRNTAGTDSHSSTAYSTSPAPLAKHQVSGSQSISPALQLRYNCLLPSNRKLRTELYASYGNNDYRRSYTYSADGSPVDFYSNSTDENSYYVKARANFSKTFKNRSSVNIDLSQDYTRTDDANMRGGKPADVTLDKTNTRLSLTYNYKIRKKLNLQVKLANHQAYVDTRTGSVTNFFFTPSVKLTYTHKRHTLQLNGSASSVEASIANRTGDEYKINEYETFIGNPGLKDYLRYSASVSYTFDVSSRFSLIGYGSLELNTNSIYRDISYDSERNTFASRYLNRGTSWVQHAELCFQYSIVPQLLYLRSGMLYSYTKSKVWETVYHTNLGGFVNLSCRWRGLFIMASYLSRHEVMNQTTGMLYKNPDYASLEVRYNWNRWYASATYVNPFKAWTDGSLHLRDYSMTYSSRIARMSDNYGMVTVGCRFNFGRKKHKFANMEVEDVNQTTISAE